MLKASVIIPTYNRPDDLNKCIQSILGQRLKPYELIIVDDGNLLDLPFEKDCRDAGIKYVYYKKDKPGLTASRNAGIKLATGDIICFLDDDVVLFPDYIEEIVRVYEDDKKGIVGGVGGVIANHKSLKIKDRLRRIFEIFFLVSGFSEGRVLPSGFFINFGDTGIPIKKIREVDFVSGGLSSFRKEIFREMSFNTEKYLGYALGEDKDFSCQVSKKYKLLINPKAKLFHYESSKMGLDNFNEYRMFIMFTYTFFKEHLKKGWWSWLFFFYALTGYILARILALLIFPNKMKVEGLKGIFSAMKDILKGNPAIIT